MTPASTIPRLAGLIAVANLAACANGGSVPQLTLPSMPSIGSIGSMAGTPQTEAPVGSATELYSRIAKGAVMCWFGAHGYLKKDYIYAATADAPSRGGKAEIIVHARDPSQPNPRGPKAYRVAIDPTSETTADIKTENIKMPEPLAATMTADVGRWSKGDQGCAETSTAAGWSAAPANTVSATPAQPAKASHKSKVKAVAAP